MTNAEFDKVQKLKGFIDNAGQVIGFQEQIFIVNPLFVSTGAYSGIIQEHIDNNLANMNLDFKSDIEGELAAKRTIFDNLTISPPIE